VLSEGEASSRQAEASSRGDAGAGWLVGIRQKKVGEALRHALLQYM
jgi:hypothetical protein